MKDLFSQIQSFFGEHKNLDPHTITMQSSLTLDLGLTSYDVIEICAYLEDLFQVEISDDILPDLSSVGDLVYYLESLTSCH